MTTANLLQSLSAIEAYAREARHDLDRAAKDHASPWQRVGRAKFSLGQTEWMVRELRRAVENGVESLLT